MLGDRLQSTSLDLHTVCQASQVCSHSTFTNYSDIKDNFGRTAADVARWWGFNNIAKLITNYKAQPRGQFSMIINFVGCGKE